MKALVVVGIVIVVAVLMRVAIYFGYRYIDKMLCVQPPIDPNKPIVLPHRQYQSAPVYEATQNTAEGDPSVMPDYAGADTLSAVSNGQSGGAA